MIDLRGFAIFIKSCENGACLTGEAHSDYTLSCRGVAQLVAHRVWDAGAGGSSPPTPTLFGILHKSAIGRLDYFKQIMKTEFIKKATKYYNCL